MNPTTTTPASPIVTSTNTTISAHRRSPNLNRDQKLQACLHTIRDSNSNLIIYIDPNSSQS